MAPPRPNTLTSLADAYNNFQAQSPPVINLMGIVVDILPPTINQKSKGMAKGQLQFSPTPSLT